MVSLNATGVDTVDNLKGQIQAKKNVPPAWLTLIYKGDVMQDGKPLSAYNFPSKGAIVLCRIGKVVGGGKQAKITKTKGNKSDKMKLLAGMVVGMKAKVDTLKGDLVKEVSTAVTTKLTAVKGGQKIVRAALTDMEVPQKLSVTKALGSNNMDHKFNAVSSIVFQKYESKIMKAKRDLDDVLEMARAFTKFAVVSEFGDEAGDVQWSAIRELAATEDAEGDSLGDMFAGMEL
jgi:hypothetical protein